MMAVLTMQPTLGDLLKYELDADYCREAITIKGGSAYPLGAVLGRITATGQYILSPAAAVVGEEGAEVASARARNTRLRSPPLSWVMGRPARWVMSRAAAAT